MTSEEALIGMRVKVGESLLRSDLRGKLGTITARWGAPDYVARDVLLDNGPTQLFWHHELEEVKQQEAGKIMYGAGTPIIPKCLEKRCNSRLTKLTELRFRTVLGDGALEVRLEWATG